MARPDQFSQWHATVSTHLPHLSRSQAFGLALWSFGMVLARSCGITSVTVVVAPLLGSTETAVRQRLREWCYDAADKRGTYRTDIDVTACFAPLVRWILAWWPATERRLVLALDATTLGTRFTVLTLSLVYRGSAIPVAWMVVTATRKGAWRPHWLALLDAIAPSIPPDWTIVVVADRGLYARWLFRHIVTRGWHPFLRINSGGSVRPDPAGVFRPLTSLVPTCGQAWAGPVTCFSTPECQLDCTVLARWDAGYAAPWLIVTDLDVANANAAWYGMRSWIECSFKDLKRGGWQWHQTKMTDPARAARLWLAMAVATLWVLSVGGAADATVPVSSSAALPDAHVARRTTARTRPRLVSCFRRGVLGILTTLLLGQPLPLGRFVPDAWPDDVPRSRPPQQRRRAIAAERASTYP